jgi:hypothetical protein
MNLNFDFIISINLFKHIKSKYFSIIFQFHVTIIFTIVRFYHNTAYIDLFYYGTIIK